jgi:hypothetical protein
MRVRRLLAAVPATMICALTLTAAPAGAATAQAAGGSSGLHGTTSVTTAPGIASALIGAGVLPLPVAPARIQVGFHGGLHVTYRFPITGGNPSLSPPSGHIYHSGGVKFVSLKGKRLEIGRFDIALAKGKIFATQVNYAKARIPVFDLDLSHAKITKHGGATTVSGIKLHLDPAAAKALNATFGLKLPANGSLVFGTASVTLRA